MTSDPRLLEILKEKAYEQKQVTLASGRQSNFYIDVKRVSLLAEGSYLIGRGLFSLIRENYKEAVGVGGLTLGADPLATAVALTSFVEKHPLEAFIVRKEAKGHGTGKMIEGGHFLKPQAEVVIVEDVVTSGGSSIEASKKVREHGWTVLGVAAVVDREEGGREALQKEGLKLYSLFRKSDFGNLM
ncbi:MAG: orotate phosphoribosyltransferase [Deltaproteobacteria bacterium]|nr:orotate phosphoribosyltransferase [Deltaproteobacteria bacterium]